MISKIPAISVDTNVLVRAVLDDDPVQAAVAKNLLKEAAHSKKLYISSYAILEMVWVLKVKGRNRQQIGRALFNLLDSPGITIGQSEVVFAAAEKYIKGKADFGDYLILAESESNGVNHLASFDNELCNNTPSCINLNQ